MRTGIALGSNLGDRLKNLREAAAYLQSLCLPDGEFLISHAYETTPVDCPPDSPVFLNAAAEIEFEGDIFYLLANLQAYEQSKGRPTLHAKNAPRSIDLDILYSDNMTLTTPALNLPHPELLKRSFVLTPLAEICPARLLPDHSKTIEEYQSELPVNIEVNKKYNIL
ncbi:MAG: 2-amino-4-hydroxy-6-hydroxymethyldihydropteridine diphosphokinase [Chthoniobacterales bacterium]